MQEELLLEILNVVKRSEAENKKAIEELRADLKEFKEETRVAINELKISVNKLEEKVDSLETKSDRIDAKTDRIEKRITDEMEDTSHMIKTLFNQTDRITNYLDLNWNMKKIN